jgi:hypothetical protein
MPDLQGKPPHEPRGWVHRLLGVPELNVAIFSLMLNLPWEFWQAPFFTGMADIRHADAVQMCTQAALADALVSLFAFWTVSS